MCDTDKTQYDRNTRGNNYKMPVMLQALFLHALYVLTFNVPNSPVMVATIITPILQMGKQVG